MAAHHPGRHRLEHPRPPARPTPACPTQTGRGPSTSRPRPALARVRELEAGGYNQPLRHMLDPLKAAYGQRIHRP